MSEDLVVRDQIEPAFRMEFSDLEGHVRLLAGDRSVIYESRD